MINAILVNEEDSVVVAIAPLKKGDTITYLLNGKEVTLTANTNIPVYHKLSRRNIKKDEVIKKYGQYIGLATEDIISGAHVHTHNLESKEK